MANISIYREAKVGQISSYHHLVCQQDFINQDIKNNPNKGNSNLMFYIENGKYKHQKFYRDGKNQDLMESLKTKELELDKFAREDYHAHKIQKKLANPDKKIRTVLQSKDLKKEFIIALGGDQDVQPSDFANKITKTIDAVLKEKGLTRENIIGVFIHLDEMGAIHGHVIFNEYSMLYKTTANQLGKPKIPASATKKETSDIIKKHREDFGKFQDIVAENMNMERGKKGSKAKHLTKAQHFEAKAQEFNQLERKIITATKNLESVQIEQSTLEQSNEIINAGRNKAKQDMEEYQLKTQKQALELTKLTKAVDSTKTELDALKTSQKDVYLQKLRIHESTLRKTLFLYEFNKLPENKQMEFIGNREKETNEIMKDFSRCHDIEKSYSEPNFDKMVEDVRQSNIEIKNQEQTELDQSQIE